MMETMEKTKSKSGKKKQQILDNDIPSVPTLEEFISDNHDGVVDVSVQKSTLCDKERVPPQPADCRENDIPYDGSSSSNTSVMPLGDLENALECTESSFSALSIIDASKPNSGTELKEIQSFNPVANSKKLDCDTTFESPIHVASEGICQSNIIVEVESETTCKVTPSAPCINSVKPDKIKSKVKMKNVPPLQPLVDTKVYSLYSNIELESSTQFASDFVEAHLHGGGKQQKHPLYELLVSYLRARHRLAATGAELKCLRKECLDHQSHLWIIETTTITEDGECQDGNPVSATHEYKVSRLNNNELTALGRSLASVKDLVCDTFSLACYTAEVVHLQAEHYIQAVITNCGGEKLPHNTLPTLSLSYNNKDKAEWWCLQELRQSISVLFTFQRRPIRDAKFVSDCQEWLSRLVAVLLRVATWQDHLFLLHHVLRCPAGVGQWAASFVQAPFPTCIPVETSTVFQNPYLNHIVTALSVLMSPVKEREHFLEQAPLRGDPAPVDPWVLVDSDGEEDEEHGCLTLLRENDLVAFLNQLPFDSLFKHILLIEHYGNRDVYDSSKLTEQHILHLFAFCTVLVQLLQRGFTSYSSPRYRQFGKRLGRLIRHTVQYASDQWHSFRYGNQWVDHSSILRLQTEYDAFFLRATYCILSSRGLGAWQFLAIVPYDTVSLSALWKLFFMLHLADAYENGTENEEPDFLVKYLDWEDHLMDSQLRLQFEEKLTLMPDAEAYYLLTAFSNMAIARSPEECEFVQAVAADLLEVGFLSAATKDMCSKSARILLAGMIKKHPNLFSYILQRLSNDFSKAGKLSLYLFRELPLQIWIPTRNDILILAHWILDYPLSSNESQLSRLILRGLNWNFSRNGLALPYFLHHETALLVVEVCLKYDQQPTAITESVKQVSHLMNRPQSHEHALSLWAWEMLSRLHLHALDQSFHNAWEAMNNTANSMPWSEEPVETLTSNSHPISLISAVLMSAWGHSPPLVCSRGLSALLTLAVTHQRYEAVIGVLELMLPLFLTCLEETLLKCDRYSAVLMSLVTADRTYMKMAKNLIAPEFPGPVLKIFGNMVQNQLENYQRYGLANPQEIVRLWILSLTQLPDWIKERGVIYLLDIVFCSAFFFPEARDTAQELLITLHQNVAGLRAGGTLSALINWVASGSTTWVSLLPRSTSDCVWYAYFVLQMEQDIQEEKTGLWRELLKELASSTGKANVDNALKRAAHSLKIPAPTSSSLAIYRWAQQCLDTPINHPLVPLLWQKFFLLFLARVPSISGVPDRGGVGDKFFEGMINLSFHKKLKKKLKDTIEYYRSQSQSSEIDEYLQQWNAQCSKLMGTFSLWLEEPRLHEPSLFLPALPPQYNSDKLAAMITGQKQPWLEYLDFNSVRASQQLAAKEWQVLRFRNYEQESANLPSASSSPPVTSSTTDDEESDDPGNRILKRLQSYDLPLPPPALRPSKTVIPTVQIDMLLNRNIMLNGLKPSFRSLTEYAQIHSLRLAEHTALDCNLLELVPALYHDVEMEVLLHAACDTGPEAVGRKPNALVCAGPADIRIKVCEARISEGTEQLIEQNRVEYDTVLSRATQPPPQKVCVASVHIEHAVSLLEREYNVSKARGNSEMMAHVQDVGITLFHHIVSMYSEDAALYPPSKQLLTGCLETLGQVFICGDESQCCQLLATVLQQPRLTGILAPHFSPAVASTPTFLQMYQTVTDVSYQQQPTELSFVLLSKFDVMRWLVTRKPRLGERSQFIGLVSKALTAAGPTPGEDKLIVHEIFRKHFCTMLLYDFPEHYGEILSFLLRASETQSLCSVVWYDLLNSLLEPSGSKGKFKEGVGFGVIRDEARRFATEMQSLSYKELQETASLMASHFTKERLQYGLYGLYPKYRNYVEPLTAFLSMLGHALVVGALQKEKGSLSDALCEQLWPSLSEMFAPWIAPYWTQTLREPTAAWIQQLTDDRSVLLPWIVADGAHARRMVHFFTECVRFILDTLPACSNILSFVWQFYVAKFAHTAVKDHVLNVVHGAFLTLPWERFWPSVQDVECMLKVVDQYLPDCHLFLGTIFIEVPWWSWVGHMLSTFPLSLTSRMHSILLSLLVKLSSEPTVRQSDKLKPLLIESRKFAWHFLDASAFETVANWFVMSCDPHVILGVDDADDDRCLVDLTVLGLIQAAAAYIPEATHFHAQTLSKRQVFVKMSAKLLILCASRNKSLLQKREADFKGAIIRMLDDIEAVVLASVPEQQQVSEAAILFSEAMVITGSSSTVAPIAVGCIVQWLSTHNRHSIVLHGLLRVASSAITCSKALGQILEAALQAYFQPSVQTSDVPTWQRAVEVLQPFMPRQPPLEDVLLTEGHILTLHAMLLKKLPLCRDIREEGKLLTILVDWITSVKPTDTTESKIPLLWGRALLLAQRQCEFSEDYEVAVNCMKQLVSTLLSLAEDKTWGSTLLGAIGIRRQPSVSNKCRLMSRAVAVYVLAQLPDGEQLFVRTSPSAPGAISMLTVNCKSTGSVDRSVPNPSVEALNALTQLETLATCKVYGELKSAVELAVRLIVDPDSSLHNGCQFVAELSSFLYHEPYLRAVQA